MTTATGLAEGVSPRAAGVQAIVLYKLAKTAGELLLGVIIAILVMTGYVSRAYELAAAMREHVVHHWSIKLAELLMSSLTGRRVWWVVAALAGDSLVSGIEGYALARGYHWAAWFVVAVTSLLLPVEVIELSYRTSIGRMTIFAVNLSIVLYLIKRAMKEHHARHPHR